MKHKRSAKQPTPDDSLDALLRAVTPPTFVRALGDCVADQAVFAVDASRTIVYWSEGAERLLGFKAGDVIGAHCLKANRCPQCIRGCGIAEHGAVREVPLSLYREDGDLVHVRKTARAFFDERGEFAGGIEVLRPDAERTPERISAASLPIFRESSAAFHGIVTRDPAMLQAFAVIRNVAETDATVLVRGESGTGKELVARAIHAESPRRKGPFIAVSCAAFTPTLLESELFGHVRGAFTGAISDRAGVFEQANGGTLFLDEVAELSAELQAKLLRVVQERTFVPVGGRRPMKVDLRLVTATHRSLRAEVRAGRFREDLLYRLRVVPLFLPPLRQRRGDIELLLWHYLARFSAEGPRRIERVAPDALRALLDHDWPGNIRELRNVVEYAFAVARGPELRMDDLPPELRDGRDTDRRGSEHAGSAQAEPSRGPGDETTRLRDALARNGGNIGAAARELGVSRATFWRKRRLHGV